MRNLKRALSLAMATFMLLGMMVVGAGAATSYGDFSDKDEIVNTEAVNTMVSLGVIAGRDTGDFDPTGVVTRGEMAKLIAVMLNGGKDPTLGAVTTAFTDAKGHWAEPFIAYCANLGILNGYGDNTVKPEGNVTGTEAAKMLLTALGYRSDIENLTGVQWTINTNVLANKVDLYNGLEVNPAEGLTRDDTAQMIYNAVQANEVEYRNNYGEYAGVIYANPINGVENDSTVLWTRFKVQKVEGVVIGNDVFDLGNAPVKKDHTRIAVTRIGGTTVGTASGNVNLVGDTFAVPSDMKLVGQSVILYVKWLNFLAPNASSATVLGSVILSDQNTVVETTGRLANDADVKDALKGSGLSVAVYTIGATNFPASYSITEKDQVLSHYTAAAAGETAAQAATRGIQSLPGTVQRFIDHNNDGKVDTIIQEKSGLSLVTSYNTKDEKLNLSGIGSVDFSDIADPEAVAKDDFVLVSKFSDTYFLTKAESVSGPVTSYTKVGNNEGRSKITIDGETYTHGSGKNLTTNTGAFTDADLFSLVDGTYTLYLDASGNILAYIEETGAIGNYGVIMASGRADDTLNYPTGKVKLMGNDGTSSTYDVNLLASAKKFNIPGTDKAREEAMANRLRNNGMANTIVVFAVDDDKSVILMDPYYATGSRRYNNASTAADLGLRNSKSNYAFGTTNVMADNNTVFFFLNPDGSYSTTVGLNKIPADTLHTNNGVNASAVYYQPASTSTIVAKAIFASVDRNFATRASYAYISSDYTKTVENGDTVYSYNVVLEDGTTSTLKSKSDSDSDNNTVAKKKVYEYSVDSKGFVTFSTANTVSKAMAGVVGNNSVPLFDPKDEVTSWGSFPLKGDVKIWNVEDTSDIFASTIGNKSLLSLCLDSDGNVQAAFIYDTQDGDMTAAPTVTLSVATPANLADNGNNNRTWTSATSGLQLSLAVTRANTNQEIAIDFDGVGLAGTIVGNEVADDADFSAATVYTANGAENGGVLTITVTTTEPGMNARVLEYNVTVYAGAVNASAAPGAVVLKGAGNNGATVASSPVALTAGSSVPATITTAAGKDRLSIKATLTAGSPVTGISITKDGNEVPVTFTAATSNADFSFQGNGDYIVTVTTKNATALPLDTEYTVAITGTDTTSLAAGGVTEAIGDNTGITYPSTVTGVKDDQTADLAAAGSTVAGGAFVGVDGANATDKLAWMPVNVPFTGAQWTDSIATGQGLAIRQTNSALLTTNWAGSFAGGIKDKNYAAASLATAGASGLDEINFTNGTDGTDGGYFTLYVLVSNSMTTKTVTLEVKFGTNTTITAGSLTPDVTVTVDVTGVDFN